MAQVPKGSSFNVATQFSAYKNVTAITNAPDPEVSCTGHGYEVNDLIQINNGWGRFDKRVFKVKTVVSPDKFTVSGVDTTNLEFYPVATAAGQAREVEQWVELPRTFSVSSSGGDAKTITDQYIQSDVDIVMNNGFNAISYTMEQDVDTIGTPSFNALRQLTDNNTDTVLRIRTRRGTEQYLPCTVALVEMMQMTNDQFMRYQVQFNGNGRLSTYAAA